MQGRKRHTARGAAGCIAWNRADTERTKHRLRPAAFSQRRDGSHEIAGGPDEYAGERLVEYVEHPAMCRPPCHSKRHTATAWHRGSVRACSQWTHHHHGFPARAGAVAR